MKKNKPKDISRGIRLEPDVWTQLEKLRKVHGSYNKLFRHWLSAGGAFEPTTEPCKVSERFMRTGLSAVGIDGKASVETSYRRTPRRKGDRTR